MISCVVTLPPAVRLPPAPLQRPYAASPRSCRAREDKTRVRERDLPALRLDLPSRDKRYRYSSYFVLLPRDAQVLSGHTWQPAFVCLEKNLTQPKLAPSKELCLACLTAGNCALPVFAYNGEMSISRFSALAAENRLEFLACFCVQRLKCPSSPFDSLFRRPAGHRHMANTWLRRPGATIRRIRARGRTLQSCYHIRT
jgi:hypothetical protein